MFTGIVEAVARVTALTKKKNLYVLEVEKPAIAFLMTGRVSR
jgi:riboflavin synthase alpha subunit